MWPEHNTPVRDLKTLGMDEVLKDIIKKRLSHTSMCQVYEIGRLSGNFAKTIISHCICNDVAVDI